MNDADKYISNLHSLNFMKLGLECPLKATNDFKEESIRNFVVFEDTESLYLKDIDTFSTYLTYKIFKNRYSTKDNVDITTYESYFYKTILGYCLKYHDKDYFDATKVSKYWNQIVMTESKILSILKQDNVKDYYVNQHIYINCKHVNNIKPFSVKVHNLITIMYIDGTCGVINLLPNNSSISSLNLYNLAQIKYFDTSLNYLFNFYLSFNNQVITSKTIEITKNFRLSCLNIFNSYYINFGIPNVYNCNRCELNKFCNDALKLNPEEIRIRKFKTTKKGL